jgi:arylsulfatase A-like enzyme
MAEDDRIRSNIIGRVGLFGASAGLFLGLFEAACLRVTELPLPLLRPHVPPSFWFFAPLLTSVAFGLICLLAGVLAALSKSRLVGMLSIAGVAGLAGDYFWLVFKFYPSGRIWFNFLRQIITPNLVFALVFAFTLAAFWITRKSRSPLGGFVEIPKRPWSRVVLGSMAMLAVALGISNLPSHQIDSTTYATSKSPAPNIVLIVLDTARADHLSSYGYFRKTTPNIDYLAQRGVLFENAISASNWTLPSMASVFTGLAPHQHGAGADTALGNGPRTLAEIVGLAGYETAGFNANPSYGTSPWGLARGFETYVDSTSTLGYSLDASRIGHDFIEPYSEEWFQRSRFNQFTARQLNEQVYHWFAHRSDRPFLLFLNYNDAHDPYEVPSPFDRRFGRLSPQAKDRLQRAKYGRYEFSSDERESVISGYDNALNYIDSQVGELLQFLERSPEWSNTYVIITADHGEAFGEHHTYTHGWDLHREVLHVPLVIAGPGIPAGVRVSHIARTRQIMPTALEWAGVNITKLHRFSLVHMWHSDYVPMRPEEPALSEVIDATPPPAPQGMISITTREWQLISCTDEHRDQLYHWPTDPLEEQDVSGLPENEAIVEHLKATILSMVEKSHLPWRDPRYLRSLSGHNFSPDPTVRSPLQPILVSPLLPPPENSHSSVQEADKELLRSLPYGEP